MPEINPQPVSEGNLPDQRAEAASAPPAGVRPVASQSGAGSDLFEEPPKPPLGKVLLADDIAVMRNLLARALRKANYVVTEARNGSEVLELVAADRPDLIVMDGMMPVMNGSECLQRLKASPATQNIPVIMCTAKSERKDVLDMARAGAVDYIVKPFRIETVLERVAKQLPGNQDQTQA